MNREQYEEILRNEPSLTYQDDGVLETGFHLKMGDLTCRFYFGFEIDPIEKADEADILLPALTQALTTKAAVDTLVATLSAFGFKVDPATPEAYKRLVEKFAEKVEERLSSYESAKGEDGGGEGGD